MCGAPINPGLDEQFDADRFGVWLEALVESGADVAAQIVARMDVDLVAAALAHHARVFDLAAVSPSLDTDGLSCEVGGYLIVATRTGLLGRDRRRADVPRCRPSRPLSSRDARVQAAVEFGAGGRRTGRSAHGPGADGVRPGVPSRAPPGAARVRDARAGSRVSPDVATAAASDTTPLPAGNPVARAYFRTVERTEAAATNEPAVAGVADVLDVLLEAGVLPQPPRALLEGARGEAPRLARIQRHMQFVRDADPLACSTRSQELAYLANAIVAGCSLQARPITTQEASDAAVAVCNLGLENWPPQLAAAGGPPRAA